MRRHIQETIVQTSPEKLYRALTDLARWPEWDPEIERIEHQGAVSPGVRFTLKPKGGPKVAMSIEDAQAPMRLVDVSHLPLAKMRTAHELERTAEGTLVRVTIETTGLLSFLWDRVIARKQAEGARAQTHALAAYAERAS